MADYVLRPATEADLSTLRALYADAALAHGPLAFTPEQVRAWVAFADEEEAFRRFVFDATTFVAEDDTGPVGFAGLDPDGRVASLYVRPDRGRRGIAGALLQRILDEAEAQGIGLLYTRASPFSQPVFERAGFRVSEMERATRRGATFELPRMVRP